MPLKLLLFFMGTFLVTMLIIRVLLQFAKTLGVRGKNSPELRWNPEIKPSVGGIAIFLSVFISIVTYLVLHPLENIFSNAGFVLFFLGMCLAFFMGLSDDAFDTKPLLKLTAQIVCGGCIACSGVSIPISDSSWINGVVTVIWTVGVMNSINMLDNMDGITASISSSAFLNFLFIGLYFCCDVMDVYVFILIGFVGSILGFLTFNKPPSRLFMGDSGSQLIGYTLAFFSVYILWDFKGLTEIPFWLKTVMLMLILAMPFMDTFTVVFNRIRRNTSPAKGGKDHTTHHLVYAGFNEWQVWLFFSCCSVTLGALGFLMLYLYSIGFQYGILLLLLPWFFLFLFLFRNTHVYQAPTKTSNNASNH
jgi:UDP-GlcNAc:undecaprenyl-phosphate GlcNAc-1-phosphate transferase